VVETWKVIYLGADVTEIPVGWSDGQPLFGLNFENQKLDGANFSDQRDWTKEQGNWKEERNPSLDGANFRGAELRNVTFRGTSLKNAIFDNAILSNVKFESASLRAASFRSATIEESAFVASSGSKANFSEVNFQGSIMKSVFKNACFDDLKIQWSTFSDTNFFQSSFRGLAGMHLELFSVESKGCDFSGTRLIEATVNNSNLNDGNFSDVIVVGSLIQHSHFEQCNMSNFAIAKSKVANSYFTQSNLIRSSFEGSDFFNVWFGEADLSYADFTNSNHEDGFFANADLEGAILLYSKFLGCATKGVKGTPAAFAKGWRIKDGFLTKGFVGEVLGGARSGWHKTLREIKEDERRS
jgi:uncharacterized protein YjbI with pentapeptide repeats